MLQKCANPQCTTPYKYFREGRLYEFQVTPDSGCQSESVPARSSRRELFWLCDVCTASHALTCSAGRVEVVGKKTGERARAA